MSQLSTLNNKTMTTAERVHPLVQRISIDVDVTLRASEVDESVVLTVASALMKENATVEKLWLHCRNLSVPLAVAFRDALAVNTSLRTLTLRMIQSSEILAILLTGVANSPSIEKLALKSCLQTQDLEILVATLAKSSLRSLYIGEAQLGEDGASILVHGLSNRLQSLELFCCSRIDSQEVIKIARALENSTLEALHLLYTDIGDEGAQALARNTTLKSLHLLHCRIGPAGTLALVGMLKLSNRMQDFALDQGMTEDGKQDLVNALNYNVSLVHLYAENLGHPFQGQVDHQLGINRFRKQYLEQDSTTITPALWSYVFARVSDKPSALFLFLQESRDMFIPHLPE
jgi:hypothetical protein